MKEIRLADLKAERRDSGTAEPQEELVLYGMPIVFDTPTVINDKSGTYTEIIKRGALDGAALSDSRLLYNHDLSKIPLARTPKTMKLNITNEGVEMRAVLADTADAKSVYTAVERGDLSGMSFAFKVPPGGFTYDRATNTRTINRIEKIYEVSVVPFPAYPQTSVEARAAMQEIKSPQREAAMIALNKILYKGDQTL